MRSAIRALLVLVVLVVVGFMFLGYRTGTWIRTAPSQVPSPTAGTSGAVEKARQRGAELGEKTAVAATKLGEKTAVAATKLQETATEAAITTKIKAKMVLDESVKARAIEVSTSGSVVTLSGTVASLAEHNRALALARETVGVTRVIDRLAVPAAPQ